MDEEWDRICEQEENPEEFERDNPEVDLELPEVYWADDLRQIEDPELKEAEIQASQKLVEKENNLKAKLESGEIDQDAYEMEYQHGLRPQKRSAATRAALATQGLTYDHLGDISEDLDLLRTGKSELLDLKVDLVKTIKDLGSEQAQELADEMLEADKITEQGHESISRQVRLSRLAPKE